MTHLRINLKTISVNLGPGHKHRSTERGIHEPLLQLIGSPCQLEFMHTMYQICSEWLQRIVSRSPSRTTVVFGGAGVSAQPAAVRPHHAIILTGRAKLGQCRGHEVQVIAVVNMSTNLLQKPAH